MSEALLLYRPGSTKDSKGDRREKIVSRILMGLVALLALFLLGELCFHFILAPRLVVRNIAVRSDLLLEKEEILELAGIDGNLNYFSLDTEEVRRRLESLPVVREVTVQKVFPDTLTISLYSRCALSVLFFTTPQGESLPLAVDEQGVVFQIGSTVQADLPVISGLRFNQLRVGMRLPENLLPLLQSLKSLQNSEPELFRLISEVRPVTRDSRVAELLLYPVQYPVRLRLMPELEPAVLRNALVVLDLLGRQQLTDRVKELDFRTGEVVYRVKEE